MRAARKRWIELVAVTLLAAGCRTTATDADVTQRLDAMFGDLHERGLFDGAVIVGDRNHIIYEHGFGYADVERQIRFTPDTPADGASLAKTFTAALVLALQREGIVDLDAPVRRLLPELPYDDVTLRHLLSHSSGIAVLDYDYFDAFIPAGEVRTTERLLSALGAQKPPLAFTPGSAFEYSSFGNDLAALAAARAAGKSYGELLSERFFRPLGMTSAFVRPGRLSEFPGVRTLGYRRVDGKPVLHEVFDLEGFAGGSNIYISARDLHRWNVSRFEETELAHIGDGRSGLTLGNWYRARDGSSHWYSGHLQGFHSEVFRDARWSVVYVSNNTLEPWLQKSIVRAARAILAGGDPRSLIPPTTDVVRREERSSLAGVWRMPDGEELTIESSDHLSIRRDHVSYRMFAVAPNTFYAPGLDFMIGFAKGADGAFSRIHVESNVEERFGVRRQAAF